MKQISKMLKKMNRSEDYINAFLDFHKLGLENEQFISELKKANKRDFKEVVQGMKAMYDIYRQSVITESFGTPQQKDVMGKVMMSMLSSIS